jgi:ABC-type nitrate/sulfonate/bicarbonate transport system substrate-binding protein
VQAYLRACQYITAANGKWTPELLDILAKWSGQNRDVLSAIPGPAYPGLGETAADSITAQEQVWLQLGLLKKPVAATDLIDAQFANAARASLHIR